MSTLQPDGDRKRGNIFDPTLPGTEEMLQLPSTEWIAEFNPPDGTPFAEYKDGFVEALRTAGDYAGRASLNSRWVALLKDEIPGASQAEKDDALAYSFLLGYLNGCYLRFLEQQNELN